MPVGRSNTQSVAKVKRKPDVIDKVREIKQRQQNWLVQREHSKQVDSAKPKQVNHNTTKSAPGRSVPQQRLPHVNLTNKAQLKYEETDRKKPQVKQEFSHWMKSRNATSPDDDYDKKDFNDSNSVCSGAESELERLVSPEIDISKEPVSEEQFGDLANEIASRVKQDLGISHRTSDSSSDFQSDHLDFQECIEDVSTWKSGRCMTYTQEAPSFNHLGTSGLTSHSCIVCNKLMLSSRHIPMMVIPCGHTMCKACSEGRKLCPACKCSVVSLTLNVMLQQVIQEYHSYPVPSTTTLKTSAQGDRENISSGITSSMQSNSFVEDNRRNCNASYQNQLLTLQTRYDVLSKEHTILSASLGKISNKLFHGKTQSKNISSQEEEVMKAIEDLQERLTSLREHRKQYESQLTDLQDEKTEVDAKMTLLSDTMSSLSREIEKVKLLAEGEKDTE